MLSIHIYTMWDATMDAIDTPRNLNLSFMGRRPHDWQYS